VLVISTAALGITSVLVGRARDAAVAQRRQARAAVDDMYSKVADQWLEDRLDPVQADFLRKALAYYESFTADDGTEPSVQLERGRAQLRLADVLRKLGRHAEAQIAYRRAIDLLGPLAASGRAGVRQDPLEAESPEPRDDDAAAHLALARTRLASSFAESGRYAEADALAREALLTPLGSSASGALIEGRTLRLLAEIERATGRPKEAEATFGRALERLADLTRNFDDVEPRYESALA
jgi:tetratricopeptide (TPR) repeat protein